ncbi:MAG: class I SAM-dependent methyltransferase [Acidimicrobiales bacterium]
MPDDGLAPEPPLYFLHIPRTAGTSVMAELDAHYPVADIFPGQLLCQLAFFGPLDLAPFRLFRGHFGVVLPDRLDWLVRGFTIVREPIEMVLSMLAYVGEQPWHPLHDTVRSPGFGVPDFLRDPGCRLLASNWQARWLAAAPPPGDMAWAPIPSPEGIEVWKRTAALRSLDLTDDELLARAGATLERMDVVGVTERLPDTLDAVRRLMGWPPGAPPGRRNVSRSRVAASDLAPADRRLADELNQVDAELHRIALRRLAGAMGDAPPAASPRRTRPAALPYVLDWAGPATGTGWHERAFDPRVGWYRWTGPDCRSVVDLPVAGAGPARLEVWVVSAADLSLLDAIEVSVDGEPVATSRRVDGLATVLSATVDLSARAPLRVELAVPHTASLGAFGPEYDDRLVGGLAVARIGVARGVATRPPAGGPGPPASRLGFNKACELEDFADPELADVIREVCAYKTDAFGPDFPAGGEHRKDWEVAMAVRALRAWGAVHQGADILGVAAGAEDTAFHLTTSVARVFVTDRYLDPGPWRPLAPLSMLVDPAEAAPAPFAPDRLVAQHMDARRLRYPDESFDGVFSSGSIEHFGSLEAVAAAAYEMGRVLKPGGVLALSTELWLGGPRGRGWSNRTLLFSADDLERYIVAASGLEPVDELAVSASAPTLATVQDLGTALAEHAAVVGGALGRKNPKGWTAWTFPHLALRQEGYVFGSVHLTLRKGASYEGAANDWARPSPAMEAEVVADARMALSRAAAGAAAAAAAAAGAAPPR